MWKRKLKKQLKGKCLSVGGMCTWVWNTCIDMDIGREARCSREQLGSENWNSETHENGKPKAVVEDRSL